MSAQIEKLIVRCPVFPSHGETEATPEGFRGMRLECGCCLLVAPDNSGWNCKPATAPIATGSP